MPQSIYAVATMDTKGHELAFVAECLRAAGVSVTMVDVGTQCEPCVVPDVDRATVAGSHPRAEGRTAALAPGDRSPAIGAMSQALVAYLKSEHESGRLSGVIGIGGSGGTALITPAMRALPIGLPKVMVSTMASGNTAPYVGSSDITLMYSVVDVAGLNSVSRRVLGNAAAAIAGMVRVRRSRFGRQTDARHDDVRRDDSMCDQGARSARSAGLRLPGVPRHGDGWPGDGETRRGRADHRRPRRNDHRGGR